MSVLRKLAVCYLVSVLAFGLAVGLRAWPQAIAQAARLLEDKLRRPAAEALVRLDLALLDTPPSEARAVVTLEPPGLADGRTLAHVDLPPIERPALEDAPGKLTLDEPIAIMPDLPSLPREVRASAARPAPRLAEGSAASITVVPRSESRPSAEAPRTADQALTPEQGRARARLAATLTPEMRQHFGLFVFVSKAAKGPLAQRAYVFKKDLNDKSGSTLTLLYDWAASTGREKSEVNPRGDRSFTATPAGLYQFDPGRMYRQYRSYSWDQEMPHAMFFNWQRAGLQTGLAIHAASGDDIAQLGMRASAGCVHLAPENARTLFELVRSEYRGQVPRFAIDGNETMSSKGKFSRRADGSLRMAEGYRVLIDIENYGGGDGDAVALF